MRFTDKLNKLLHENIDPTETMTPDRKMDDRELTRALRKAIALEQDAIQFYEVIADASGNELVSKMMQDVADEERVHIGEFQELLNRMLPGEAKLLQQGADEVNEG